jgi:glucosamine--fructose-6-phosphate aminotransferase (isomerizing)
MERLSAEMEAQPSVIRGLLAQQTDTVFAVAERLKARPPRAVIWIGRGSSRHAALYGRALFEVRNGLLTASPLFSSVTVYGQGPQLENTCVIAVSQSGTSEDVVGYMKRARAQNALTVAIVNDAQSPLAHSAEWVLPCMAGVEAAVPATKSVTAQMCLAALLSSALSERYDEGFHLLPDAIAGALALPTITEAISKFQPDRAFAIGRGFAWAAAQEVALKLQECCLLPTQAYSFAEFMHGPAAMVDERLGAVLVDAGSHSQMQAQMAGWEVQRRGGKCLTLSVGPTASGDVALVASLPEHLAALPAVVLGQRLAFEWAKARGIDASSPRGLSKVTSTR